MASSSGTIASIKASILALNEGPVPDYEYIADILTKLLHTDVKSVGTDGHKEYYRGIIVSLDEWSGVKDITKENLKRIGIVCELQHSVWDGEAKSYSLHIVTDISGKPLTPLDLSAISPTKTRASRSRKTRW